MSAGNASVRPRATFLMLTYRQQHLVRQSVRSALAQDYPDLQIIISDDCSPDQTFAAVNEETAGYSGPHRLLLRQSGSNLGLVAHLYEAARLADGDLIIVAAGDDISCPQRVRRLVEAWQVNGADALCSGWDVIDEDGHLLQQGCSGGRSDLRFASYFPGRPFTPITGATAAYTPDVFRLVPPPSSPVFAEDLYLSLMLHWRGRKLVQLPEPLLAYREHRGAITHTGVHRESAIQQELRVERESARIAELLAVIERMTSEPPSDDGWGPPSGIDHDALRQDIAFNSFRSGWTEAGTAARLAALIRFADPAHRRWLLPRLAGPRVLGWIKMLAS